MKFLKLFFLPIIGGAIIGAIVLWSLDGFEPKNAKSLVGLLLKSILPCLITVILLNAARQKEKK